MKKNIAFTFVACFIIVALLFALMLISGGFTLKEDKDIAKVNTLNGFYIFVDSRPVMDYEVIGEEKAGGVQMKIQYEGIRDVLIKKSRKDFPQADGLIFSFPDKVTVIKFK